MSREGDFGNIKMNTPVTKQTERRWETRVHSSGDGKKKEEEIEAEDEDEDEDEDESRDWRSVLGC